MLLFAFRSRTQSLKLYDTFRMQDIDCKIVNTPRKVSASCGLTVTVDPDDAPRALDVYESAFRGADTLIGIFIDDAQGFRRYR